MKTGIIFGTWDLFHAGHLNALINASYQCDLLWVGVYSDQVVNEYKGRYPIITQADRMQLIRYLHLNCCINVVPIMKRAPMDLSFVSTLFLCEDWKERNFPILNDTFKGEIVYLSRTKGIDTSSIIAKCKNEKI